MAHLCKYIHLTLAVSCGWLQARADGGDEMDDLLSAPRMVLSQFVDKWFPDADSETTAFPTSRLQKLLLDVSSELRPDVACSMLIMSCALAGVWCVGK